MAFGTLDDGPDARPLMADINTTPLVDVMLVLLVIFIITAPLFTSALKLDLPEAKAPTLHDPSASIDIAIEANGALHWNDDAVDDAQFVDRLKLAAARTSDEDITLRIRADKATRYERIAFVMSRAQANGLTRLAFLTAPEPSTTP